LVGDEPRTGTVLPKEEIATDTTLPYSSTLDNSVEYEMHPQIGALPPRPTDKPIAVSNSLVCELPGRIHPDYGLFPSHGDNVVYAQQLSGVSADGFPHVSDSESELAGQSQPGSVVTSTFQTDSNISSQLISYDTTSSSDVMKDSLDMLKLEAKVKDLTVQLEKAQTENRRKDSQIRTLQQLLAKASTPEPTTKNFGSHSFV
jgi:hypothetical protein